jgi:hypothetical protein
MPIVALSAGQFGPQLACAQGPQAAPAPALPVGHVLTSTSAPSVLVTEPCPRQLPATTQPHHHNQTQKLPR